MPAGFLALILSLLVIILLPLFVADLMIQGLVKLGFSPLQGLLVVASMIFGSLINIPIKRLPVARGSIVQIRRLYGLNSLIPARIRVRRLIAVNLGGCVVPCLLAGYQLNRLAATGDLPGAALAIAINVVACRYLSKPVPGLGIMIQPLWPGLIGALSALLIAPGNAPPVAFCAGVLGPLIGADLLRLRQLARLDTGSLSIGGAGTFDGIVITSFIALLLV